MTGRRLVGALCVALLLSAPAGQGAAVADSRPAVTEDWRALLARAATTAKERSFRAETLWVTETPKGPQSSVVEVRGGAGRLHVGSPERVTLRLGYLGGDVVHYEQGWFTPLPPADRRDLDEALDALAGKYRVERGNVETVIDRHCIRLDIYRRADGSLAERFCLDVVTGLLLRRETFDRQGDRLRLAAHRSLDLSPPVDGERGQKPERGALLERRPRQVKAVGDRHLAALRKAGYVVPARLPGGYERVGVYASAGTTGALQAVYRDGLYTMSVFQQRGRPDWSSLPDGAERATGLDWPAHEWPGAVPTRLVWEASGWTFFLIGDAPPDDLVALTEALPKPASQRPLDRLRRGLSRIWSAVSPWE